MMQNSAYQTPTNQTAIGFMPHDRQQRVRRGVVYLVLATILGWTPWFSGPSWPWSLALMSLALLIGAEPWTKNHDRGALLMTLLCAAIAWQLLHLGIGVVPWLLASFFLISAQTFRLDFSRWRSGYGGLYSRWRRAVSGEFAGDVASQRWDVVVWLARRASISKPIQRDERQLGNAADLQSDAVYQQFLFPRLRLFRSHRERRSVGRNRADLCRRVVAVAR